MTEQICPTCGCSFGDNGYAKGGTIYCCEPCAENGKCECGCCHTRSTNMPDSGAAAGEGEPG